MIAHLKLGAALAVAGACFASGWKVRDYSAVKADLARERAAAEQLAAIQKGMDLAAQETERRLAVAARNLVAARSDSERVQQLAARVRASEQASEHDRRRIEQLARLVAESASVVEEGIGIVGRLDARLAGCQASP